ncbi:MAG TPA: hypothetical protein PKJ16_07740 [Spirochaetota bacterium]|nr:hypothetical protein [Spirochaetota bacterium]HPU88687.1 hypothetical protein [Spirochaetota bacterium]
MILQAIKKDGGFFIPDVEGIPSDQSKISVDLVIVDTIDEKKKKLFNTAGILKEKNIDGVEYQKFIRNEWE